MCCFHGEGRFKDKGCRLFFFALDDGSESGEIYRVPARDESDSTSAARANFTPIDIPDQRYRSPFELYNMAADFGISDISKSRIRQMKLR